MRFKVGDRVQVTQSGFGCHPSEIGTVVVIESALERGYSGPIHGYRVHPEIGNSRKDSDGHYFCYNGYIGEGSFKLVTPIAKQDSIRGQTLIHYFI